MCKVLIVTPTREDKIRKEFERRLSKLGATIARVVKPEALPGISLAEYDAMLAVEANGASSDIRVTAFAAKVPVRFTNFNGTKDWPQVAEMFRTCCKPLSPPSVRPTAEFRNSEPEPVEAVAEVAEAIDNAPVFDGEKRDVLGWPLVKLEGEELPRLLDTDLGEKLEYPEPRQIRELIKSHEPALREIAPLSQRRFSRRYESRPGVWQERDVLAYCLTEEQAAYVASKSERPKAVALTIAMVKVFIAWGKGTLPANTGPVPLAEAFRHMAQLAEDNAAIHARQEALEAQQEADRAAQAKALEDEKRARKEAEAALAAKVEAERAEREADQARRDKEAAEAEAKRKAELAKLVEINDTSIRDIKRAIFEQPKPPPSDPRKQSGIDFPVVPGVAKIGKRSPDLERAIRSAAHRVSWVVAEASGAVSRGISRRAIEAELSNLIGHGNVGDKGIRLRGKRSVVLGIRRVAGAIVSTSLVKGPIKELPFSAYRHLLDAIEPQAIAAQAALVADIRAGIGITPAFVRRYPINEER
jgi:hypothetical protein